MKHDHEGTSFGNFQCRDKPYIFFITKGWDVSGGHHLREIMESKDKHYNPESLAMEFHTPKPHTTREDLISLNLCESSTESYFLKDLKKTGALGVCVPLREGPSRE